jgi:alpha-glucosidase
VTGGRAWWFDAVVYQVYPRSFADSDGDGVGDLAGALGRLDHLSRLGVDALWLSPFYPSPMADAGYDVTDHCDVDPVLGSLTDAEALLERAHALGLRVIVDVIPNHTSDAHPWFRAATTESAGAAERGVYVIRRGRGSGGREPPNNWLSVFGGPAWTRLDTVSGSPSHAGWWYLHSFDPRQPDLDWDNPEVRARFEDVLRFWLARGVDGFRVDVAHGLVKAPGLPDWSDAGRRPHADGTWDPDQGTVDLGPMFDQDEVHDIYRSWRRLLERYPGDRVLVGEAVVGSPERTARYVGPDGLHQAFNFAFLKAPWDAVRLRRIIDGTLAAMAPRAAPASWVLSNHDVVRAATRFGYPDTTPARQGIGTGDEQPDPELGRRRARAAALLMLSLPGSATLYQGEELGLGDHTTLPDEARQDPIFTRSGGRQRGRDGCRVPLPWESSRPAYGFSPTGRSWLPQPAEWADLAVDRQQADPRSTLTLYRRALALRRRHRLGTGSVRWDGLGGEAEEKVLAFRNGEVLSVVNLGDEPVDVTARGTMLLRSDSSSRPADPLGPDCAAWVGPAGG